MKGTFSIRKEIQIDYREFIVTLLSDGLHFFDSYGFSIDYSDEDYASAKSYLAKMNPLLSPCLEDVQAQMILDDKEIKFIDEDRYEYNATLTLSKIEKALYKYLDEEPNDGFILAVDKIVDQQDYDAEDCDFVLQYILFGDALFS